MKEKEEGSKWLGVMFRQKADAQPARGGGSISLPTSALPPHIVYTAFSSYLHLSLSLPPLTFTHDVSLNPLNCGCVASDTGETIKFDPGGVAD